MLHLLCISIHFQPEVSFPSQSTNGCIIPQCSLDLFTPLNRNPHLKMLQKCPFSFPDFRFYLDISRVQENLNKWFEENLVSNTNIVGLVETWKMQKSEVPLQRIAHKSNQLWIWTKCLLECRLFKLWMISQEVKRWISSDDNFKLVVKAGCFWYDSENQDFSIETLAYA